MPHIYVDGKALYYKNHKTTKPIKGEYDMKLGDKSFLEECNKLEQLLCDAKSPEETTQTLDNFKATTDAYFRMVSETAMLYIKTKFNSYTSAYHVLYGYDNKGEKQCQH